MELVHIGHGNMLDMGRVVAMASTKSATTRRLVREVRNRGLEIDLTGGRRTKAFIVTDSNHIILSAIDPETIASRVRI